MERSGARTREQQRERDALRLRAREGSARDAAARRWRRDQRWWCLELRRWCTGLCALLIFSLLLRLLQYDGPQQLLNQLVFAAYLGDDAELARSLEAGADANGRLDPRDVIEWNL